MKKHIIGKLEKLKNMPRKVILGRAIVVLSQLALGPALVFQGASPATALAISGIFALTLGYHEDLM